MTIVRSGFCSASPSPMAVAERSTILAATASEPAMRTRKWP